MDYEEKYKEAIEGIQEILSSGQESITMSRLKLRLQGIFPELKESGDEKIRKALIRFHKSTIDVDGIKGEDILAWLEKQGEQKPDDNIEPKFKVGDKITYIGERKELIADNKYTIKEISKNCYISTLGNKIPFSMQEYYTTLNDTKFKVDDWVVYDHRAYQVVELPKEGCINLGLRRNGKIVFAPSTYCRLWTIQDAKDGDVLYLQKDGKEHIIIYKGIIKERFRTFVSAYCAYNGIVDDFCFADVSRYADIAYGGVMPATEEQRDTLFSKMHEAGYAWDAEKKEFKLLITNGGDFESMPIDEEVQKLHDANVRKEFKWDSENKIMTIYGVTYEEMKALDDFIYCLRSGTKCPKGEKGEEGFTYQIETDNGRDNDKKRTN